jgi:hypothetical protein
MRAYRSPLRLFVFGIIGIVLIATASDILFGHWISTVPDSIDGNLTTRGRSQQRGDVVWGGVMLVAGVLIFGGAVIELFRRKATVTVRSDGLMIDSSPTGGFIPWGSVDSISSVVVSDPYDGSVREQLVVELLHDVDGVEGLSGRIPDGDAVYIDAHDWSNGVTEVALAAQGAHDHYRRVEAVRDFEPPSMVWQADVDGLDPDATSERAVSDNDAEESDE